MARIRYSIEFKLKAIRQVLELGKSVSQAAEELRINKNTLRAWISGHRSKDGSTESRVDTRLNEQLTKLRAENQRLRDEREVLIKAAAIIAMKAS